MCALGLMQRPGTNLQVSVAQTAQQYVQSPPMCLHLNQKPLSHLCGGWDCPVIPVASATYQVLFLQYLHVAALTKSCHTGRGMQCSPAVAYGSVLRHLG